ncbi:response regulator transcription factor [Sphaerisporangium sp. TRM90804]|uniref:response regulator transcription factor n=1 Tax=Sphaerisporangium sp. TRM90804 TaxID=3031113 RepID=UPI00244D4B55|nr:response regulator transcription factor [Sphaerisporangium sp. TRM90804]MDH2428807.1 response regulator transcription factor [Sphaerisporangium sp. TRM90804]
MTIRVLLVDDQAWLRLGFRAVLEQEPDLEVVGEAGDGERAVAQTRALRPDVVLMDVRMPAMDGIEATRRIVASGSAARVLMLTTFDLDEYVFAALRAGASGFLLKDALPADLLSGIRVVASGDAAVAPAVTRRLISAFASHLPVPGTPAPLDALTARERDVLMALARARSNAEIAARLHISEATVKVHVGRVLGKLGLRDRAQAVVFAYENGVIRAGAPGTETSGISWD